MTHLQSGQIRKELDTAPRCTAEYCSRAGAPVLFLKQVVERSIGNSVNWQIAPKSARRAHRPGRARRQLVAHLGKNKRYSGLL